MTCLYRAGADSFAAKWEALGIATDFAPSALVAPLVGVNEFGLGSTLAFRKERSRRRLAASSPSPITSPMIISLGSASASPESRCTYRSMPVETHLGAGTWKSVWDHQVRWARTIRPSPWRLSRPSDHERFLMGRCCAFASAGGTSPLAPLFRLIVGLTAGLAILHDPITARYWWLMPLRDLYGFGVWVAGADRRRGHLAWKTSPARRGRPDPVNIKSGRATLR